MATAFITHKECLLHEMESFHPECPSRIRVIEDFLRSKNDIISLLKTYEAPYVEKKNLLLVHTSEYVEYIEKKTPSENTIKLDPDTALNPYSFKSAKRAAGAIILAVDLVMKKEVDNAFCCVRPPGHHAEKNRAMGFCIFNNIAIGAAYALNHYKLDKIAILDFDVHQGNGTENIFADDDRVLFCSTFQYPFYPYKEYIKNKKNFVNVPLRRGMGSHDFRNLVKEFWFSSISEFKPKMILISAGFDGHKFDPIGQQNLTNDDYYWITTEIKKLAINYCEGRIISTLEGGYNLDILGGSVGSHVLALMS